MKAPEQYRITKELSEKYSYIGRLYAYVSDSSYGNNGAFLLPREGKTNSAFFFCIVSDGEGWEHVSVHIPSEQRCPSWTEMCYIKNMFWDEDEAVMQLHPPKSEYVNNHNFCLHLWRPVNAVIPLPASILVGLKRKRLTH